MTGTETDSASKQWGIWFTAGEVSRTQAYRWYRGEQAPTRENAALVADTLGVDRRQAYMASGHEIDPDTPIIGDPAEAFVQAIRSRGFPPAVEERLVAEIRAEIERRRQSLEDQLNTVAIAVGEKPPES